MPGKTPLAPLLIFALFSYSTMRVEAHLQHSGATRQRRIGNNLVCQLDMARDKHCVILCVMNVAISILDQGWPDTLTQGPNSRQTATRGPGTVRFT